jgi:hypothetical protein
MVPTKNQGQSVATIKCGLFAKIAIDNSFMVGLAARADGVSFYMIGRAELLM